MATIASVPVEILSHCCAALQMLEHASSVDTGLAPYLISSVSAHRLGSPSPHSDRPVPPKQVGFRHSSALISLSETCYTLRAVSVPLLWHSLWLTLDFKQPNRCIKHCLSLLGRDHPAQIYAKSICIAIRRNHDDLSSEAAERLDLLLAHCIHSMPNVINVYAEIDATRHQWPNILLAIMRLPKVTTVHFNGMAGVQLPRSLALPVERLAIDAQLQRTSVDLLCFPNLRHLTLGLEDAGSDENWQRLTFPPEVWRSLQSLELYGTCKNSRILFARLRDSMLVRRTDEHADDKLTLPCRGRDGSHCGNASLT